MIRHAYLRKMSDGTKRCLYPPAGSVFIKESDRGCPHESRKVSKAAAFEPEYGYDGGPTEPSVTEIPRVWAGEIVSGPLPGCLQL